MNFNVTSGGTVIGVAPTRECVEEVVEKHCARNAWEKAGTKNVGSELARTGSRKRKSCVKQRCVAAQDMVCAD